MVLIGFDQKHTPTPGRGPRLETATRLGAHGPGLGSPGRPFRRCRPRDLFDQVLSIAESNREWPTFTPDLFDAACATDFVGQVQRNFSATPTGSKNEQSPVAWDWGSLCGLVRNLVRTGSGHRRKSGFP